MSGKGSTPRPLSVDRKTFEDNWNRIFNKSKVDSEIQDLKDLKNKNLPLSQKEAWMKDEYYDIWDEK